MDSRILLKKVVRDGSVVVGDHIQNVITKEYGKIETITPGSGNTYHLKVRISQEIGADSRILKGALTAFDNWVWLGQPDSNIADSVQEVKQILTTNDLDNIEE